MILIDLSPEGARARMEHGHIYPPEQAQAALESFFRPENLAALRELALRRTAQEVDEQLDEYMREIAHRPRGSRRARARARRRSRLRAHTDPPRLAPRAGPARRPDRRLHRTDRTDRYRQNSPARSSLPKTSMPPSTPSPARTKPLLSHLSRPKARTTSSSPTAQLRECAASRRSRYTSASCAPFQTSTCI